MGDCSRRSPGSEERDEEGREEDEAGRFETSRLALPFTHGSRVGETMLLSDKSGVRGGHTEENTGQLVSRGFRKKPLVATEKSDWTFREEKGTD